MIIVKSYRMVILSFSLVLFLQPVGEISFKGNNTVSSKKLNHIISTKSDSIFSRTVVDHDRIAIIDYYRKQGFFETKVLVSCQGDSLIDINFEIEEGQRPRIDRIYYPVDSATVYDHTDTRIGDFMLEERILKDIVVVEDYLADNGHPFAKLRYNTLFSNDTLFLFWDLKKGQRFFIRNTTIEGLENVPERLIRHSLVFKRGDLFSQKSIAESQKNIYLLFLFRLVQFQYHPTKQGSIDILISLEEGRPFGVNLGLGFMTPNRLISSITFENLNVMGSGNQLVLPVVGWVNLGGEYSLTASLEYQFLYPLNLPIAITFGPFIEREKRKVYGLFGYGAEGTIKRSFHSFLEVSLSYQYRKVSWQKIPLTEGLTNSITAKAILDYRDHLLDPRKGIFFLPSISYGGGFFGGDNNFVRYLADLRFFIPLPGFTYAWRLRAGEIFELPGGLEIHEKYQIVSSSALRGYPDYAIGPESIGNDHYGSFLVGVQTEPRFHLGKFGLVAFLDLGTLLDNHNSFSIDVLEIGAGFGLRYLTPIGPIRLDWGKRMKNPEDNDKGIIYLTLQHAF